MRSFNSERDIADLLPRAHRAVIDRLAGSLKDALNYERHHAPRSPFASRSLRVSIRSPRKTFRGLV